MNAQLLDKLKNVPNEYKSIPFWSWNNHLDEEYLVKQIRDMKAADIGGFIMHARTGLKDEYLGEKWFSCIEACLKEARRLKMDAWVYDENGWPSGFVGGKLLENEAYRARFLELKRGDFDPSAFCVYVADENGYKRVTEPQKGVTVYENIYLRVSPANSDILNPDVTDAFIRETHEKYYARFKEYFGKELVGFFTDEPQYYRYATPYTAGVGKVFEDNGEDVRDGLIWLFKSDERGYAFREKYYAELNRLYVTNFYKKLYDWCEAHGCKLTGHSVEESSLGMQMWGGAEVTTTYEYEHIPAMDDLARICTNELAPKQISSACSQLGKKHILTETYGCSGNDVTPYELKSVGDLQYFLGVNKMCQHLYPYSLARGGKTDHPPVFSRHGNWYDGFKTFNEYFNRLGYIVANTHENADVAVIHPIRDIWLDYIREIDYPSIKETEERFAALMNDLRKKGVTYQFIDETLLKKYGRNEADGLRVGERLYKTVLMPEMKTISANTLDVLRNFKGELCVLGCPKYIDGVKADVKLKGNLTYDELTAKTAIKYTCDDARSFMASRSGELGDFIFVKNFSYDKPSKVKFVGVAENYKLLDLEFLTEKDITDEFELRAGEGLVLIKDEAAKPSKKKLVKTDYTHSFGVENITQNYLVMDYCQVARNNDKFGDIRPIYGHIEDLLREDYKGEISVRQTFTLNEKLSLTFVMEKADLKKITVNGKPITLKNGDFDVNFVEADITGEVVTGENEIIYTFDFYQHDGVRFALFDPLATESLRNCLYYDTTIETSYLKGEFTVGKDRSLSAKKNLPPLTDRLLDNGYPFFKGQVEYKGKIAKPENGRAILALGGRFMTAKIKTKKGEVEFVLDNRGDITDILSDGENEVEITLNSSLRNLFGPHHFKPEAEPLSVSPWNFEFRGGWKDGKNPEQYTDEYNCVPFGLSSVTLVNEK